MNQISEILSKKRTETGITLKEAAEDLNYDVSQLEAIEQGDFKNFKDIFVLKVIVGDYAKYLGLDANKIIDEFNDYVFESTSKIPIDEIKKASLEKEKKEKDKIMSPYTITDKKNNGLIKILVVIIAILIIVAICIIKYNSSLSDDSDSELKVGFEVHYEE